MSTAFHRYLITIAVALSPSIARLNLFFTAKTQVACIDLLIFVALQLLNRNLLKRALPTVCSLIEALLEAFLEAFGESSFEGLHLRVG